MFSRFNSLKLSEFMFVLGPTQLMNMMALFLEICNVFILTFGKASDQVYWVLCQRGQAACYETIESALLFDIQG